MKSTLKFIFLVTILLLASCSAPQISTDRYHDTSASSQRSDGPVTELHRQAIAALNQQQFEQAIALLQRAIKIEPRNAFSWHYLAQSYWHISDFDNCVDMVQRSLSYSSVSDDLDRANAALLLQCRSN